MIFFLVFLVFASDGRILAQGNRESNDSKPDNKPMGKSGTAGDVAHGKYIVEGVSMCGQCHTPSDSNGNLDRSQWLQGSPVKYASPTGDPNWPIMAPRIGGTPPASDEDMIKLLTTGIWTTGARLRLPMPQFRMVPGDAAAVVAYLKSLKPDR